MNFLTRAAAGALLLLLINTAYVVALPAPTIFYMTNVLAHVGLGLLTVVLGVELFRRNMLPGIRIPLVLLLASAAAAVVLLRLGNLREHRSVLIIHIVFGAAFVIAFLIWLAKQAAEAVRLYRRAVAGSAALLVVLPAAAVAWRHFYPDPRDRIKNSMVVPLSMHEEGGGPKSPFFPSPAQTNVGGVIPANFFLDSKLCGECHKDIYNQWESSAHHFASMNNQFYRKSIEYMQDIAGTQPSKWCAGCHDHAMFFNGRFDKPIREQIDTPEAHAGLACTSCHSIRSVQGTTGNGGFTIEYPPLHELASSRNPLMKEFATFLTYLNPEPHRQTFMKPFMRQDSAEFCSACHKVHLDVPVNNYRWFRGFNDYDAWQSSGVSGQGARSFYYPAKSSTCTDCHMPLVDSRDPGHRDGKVHSHRFPAANLALAHVNNDTEQKKAVEQFLKSGIVSVDIFAAAPVDEKQEQTPMLRRTGETPPAMTSFAVGEEANSTGPVIIREVGKIAAPLDQVKTQFQPGSTLRFDVVARTRRVGHFFPGGTVDAFDVWLEVQAKDSSGRTIFWSGRTEEGGPVDPGAHFYRSYQLDAEGNPINKRNAWQARSVLYVRLIPPGAADVAHYRIKIPSDVSGPVTISAKLNYRKFSHYYTEFSYAGRPLPGQQPSLFSISHDSRQFGFDPSNIPQNVSGRIRDRIPALPVTTLAQSSVTLQTSSKTQTTNWQPVLRNQDYERWNDWGIGLLLQGDIKGAEYAFRKVTEARPDFADGWLNVARALIQEGETDEAKPFLARAAQVGPKLSRIDFFHAMVQKADGDYDGAIASLQKVLEAYPRDRVALNQLARIQYLKREYQAAIATLDRVCLIDPEDLQMHYTMMLCYRGLGDAEKVSREEALFRRFKAEESSQSITARRRMLSPEDNNERQQIHDHVSAQLDTAPVRETPRPPMSSKALPERGTRGDGL